MSTHEKIFLLLWAILGLLVSAIPDKPETPGESDPFTVQNSHW